jgi:hypothetical protein
VEEETRCVIATTESVRGGVGGAVDSLNLFEETEAWHSLQNNALLPLLMPQAEHTLEPLFAITKIFRNHVIGKLDQHACACSL